MAPNPVSTSQQSKRKSKKSRIAKDPELERLDSLPWNSAIPSEDPSSFLDGPDELEGGFLSLEEIDESEYVLKIPEPGSFSKKEKPIKISELKKRKRSSEDGGSRDEVEVEDVSEENVEEKKVKKTKKKKKKAKKTQNNVESTAVSNGKDDVEGEFVDESEFYAWNELRLHPLLMKSIYRLGFKEPTAIQKACIPTTAHQGKDIIGAAETGSGKTLAFGLPILQRLLEEQEKAANQLPENGAAVEKYAPRGPLRALILAPTRELALQVTDHLKEVAQGTIFRVVPIVGGLSSEKQERLLRTRPEIIVGTPGRLWELMSGGENHLVELHSLSFFVLDEADRMIQSGHFRELESIIDMIRANSGSIEDSQITQKNVTVSSFQRKKRQTFVFSATIALSADFRKKLKRGSLQSKRSFDDGLKSIETLSERAGMRTNTAIIDLTNASILANKLEESFIECREDDKDSYLYYILRLHGQGRTIVFCTSIAALRHISSLLGTLEVKVCSLHAQMQQRARLNAIDRFRKDEHGILVATDVAARGLDIPGVRMVVHYQLPHSAEVYVHRSGRTARASADGCSIALISPNERSKFGSLCKSFSKESFQRFPLEYCYMPEILKRVSLAHQIDKISQKDSKAKAKKTWLEKNAEAVELIVEENDSEEERVNSHKQKKVSSMHLKKLQQELKVLLSRPLQPDTLKHKYFAGAGVTPLMQHQLQELSRQKLGEKGGVSGEGKRRKVVVIGQESSVDAVEALRSGGQEVSMDTKQIAEKRRNMEALRKKRKEEKKRSHDQKRKQKKRLKGMD